MAHSSKFRYIVLSLLAVIAGFSVWYVRDAIQAAIARKSAGPTSGLEQGLVGYWSFDEDAGTTVPDHSGQGNTGTATNGPVGTTGQLGRALQFDGVNDYVSVANSSSLGTGDNDFSVSFWVKLDNKSSNYYFVSKAQGTGADYDIAYIGGGTDRFRFIVYGGASANVLGTVTANTFGSPSANTWYFITAVHSSNQILVSVNGGPPDSSTESGTVGNSSALAIGSTQFGSGSGYMPGSLDDVRIYNRVLSANEIKRLYNQAGKVTQGASPTHALSSGLVGYWTMDASGISGTSLTDRSGNGNTGTLTNGPAPALGKIGQALQFDGSSSYVSVASNASLNLTTNGTISAWVKPSTFTTDASGGNRRIVSKRPDPTTSNNEVYGLLTDSTQSRFEVRLSTGASTQTLDTATTNIATNQWYHLLTTWDGTTVRIYLNGAQDNSAAQTVTPGVISQPLNIGVWTGSAGNSGFFQGSIDDVRVYNRALTASEVSQLYTLGQPKINASQNNRLTSGLVGLWSFNGPDLTATTATDRSGQGNNGTLTNGPVPVIGKIGQALQFNGVNNNVQVSSFPFAAGDYSIAMWIKSTSSANGSSAVNLARITAVCDTTFHALTLGGTNGGIRIYASCDNSISDSTSLDDNQWHFVAGTVSGTTGTVYVDGQQKNSGSVVSAPLAVTNTLYIGTNTLTYFNGSIDDVRIYNRALSASEVRQLYNMGR